MLYFVPITVSGWTLCTRTQQRIEQTNPICTRSRFARKVGHQKACAVGVLSLHSVTFWIANGAGWTPGRWQTRYVQNRLWVRKLIFRTSTGWCDCQRNCEHTWSARLLLILSIILNHSRVLGTTFISRLPSNIPRFVENFKDYKNILELRANLDKIKVGVLFR